MSQYFPKPYEPFRGDFNVKVDTDKLAAVPVNLSKLSNVVKNDTVKKIAYDKLAVK